jgi:hypothetical protein
MTSYKEHDTNTDPILVLPCGHFFAMSSLDGHFGMSEVYARAAFDCQDYVALKLLSGADINEKPRTCPDCRRIAHSIYRYGRIFRFSELRALERKHKMIMNHKLACLVSLFKQQKATGKCLLRDIDRLEKDICKGPMATIWEACAGNKLLVDLLKPPSEALLGTLELLGRVHANEATTILGGKHHELAINSYCRAISLADESRSIRSAARIRLRFVETLTKRRGWEHEIKDQVHKHLGWVLANAEAFNDLYETALRMKSLLLDPKKEIAQVMMAVLSSETGYEYGTSWSSHWYQCPNGHPYYIGECGRAMQESICAECRERVGGTGHLLNPSNSQVRGIFADAMNSINE